MASFRRLCNRLSISVSLRYGSAFPAFRASSECSPSPTITDSPTARLNPTFGVPHGLTTASQAYEQPTGLFASRPVASGALIFQAKALRLTAYGRLNITSPLPRLGALAKEPTGLFLMRVRPSDPKPEAWWRALLEPSGIRLGACSSGRRPRRRIRCTSRRTW